jgi:hypothetical protein
MFFYKLLNFFTITEFWDKPAEKSGKVLAAFLEGLPCVYVPFSSVKTMQNNSIQQCHGWEWNDNIIDVEVHYLILATFKAQFDDHYKTGAN